MTSGLGVANSCSVFTDFQFAPSSDLPEARELARVNGAFRLRALRLFIPAQPLPKQTSPEVCATGSAMGPNLPFLAAAKDSSAARVRAEITRKTTIRPRRAGAQ